MNGCRKSLASILDNEWLIDPSSLSHHVANDSSEFTIPIEVETTWIVRLKEEEIARLRDTVRTQDAIIRDLIAANTCPSCSQAELELDHPLEATRRNAFTGEKPPNKRRLSLLAQQPESGGKCGGKGKRQLLHLKEFITLERQAHWLQNRQIMAQLDRMALDLSARVSRTSEEQVQRLARERSRLLDQVGTLTSTINALHSSLQEAVSINQNLANMVTTTDTLLKHFLSAPPVICPDVSFSALHNLLDEVEEFLPKRSERRSNRLKTFQSIQNSQNGSLREQSTAQTVKEKKLREKVSSYKRRVRALERENEQVKQIMDGLIPLVGRRRE